MNKLKSWLRGDSSRWKKLANATAITREGVRKPIRAVTDREVIFGHSDDFVLRDGLLRRFQHLSLSDHVAATIERDLRTDDAAAFADRKDRIEAECKVMREAEEIKQKQEAASRELEKEHHRKMMERFGKKLESIQRDKEDARHHYEEILPHLRSRIMERDIGSFCHFTQIENLASILRHGLKPRSELRGVGAAVNDHRRADNIFNAINLSVSFPNYRMFYALRSKPPKKGWVVLRLSPEAVVSQFCLFNPTNAADRRCTNLPWSARARLEAFDLMFAEVAEWASQPIPRARLGLTADLPTDPQAEILAVGCLPACVITGIAFEDSATRVAWERVEPDLATTWQRSLVTDTTLFRPRHDHAAWSVAGNKPAAREVP